MAEKYEKNFEKWRIVSEKLQNRSNLPFFKEKEIWWCSIGINLGSEEDSKNDNFERPVIILLKYNLNLFLGIPTSTRPKTGKYFLQFEFNGHEQTALISQLRVLSAHRLLRKEGLLDDVTYNIFIKQVKKMFNV